MSRQGWPRYQSTRTSEKKVMVVVRLPQAIVDTLDTYARNAYRSRTAEVLLRLEYTLHIDHEVMVAHRRAKANEEARGGHA